MRILIAAVTRIEAANREGETEARHESCARPSGLRAPEPGVPANLYAVIS